MECPNCFQEHPSFTDHCVFQILGATLIDQGHSADEVRAILNRADPMLVWDAMYEHIVYPLVAGDFANADGP